MRRSAPASPGLPGQQSDHRDAALGRAQIRGLLEEAVSELPSDLRLPFLMREAEGMRLLAIARDLSLNPVIVKTRLFRARRRLRKVIGTSCLGRFDAAFPFEGSRSAGMADRVIARLKENGQL
jgi:RNA polymerase sigma-70 factor (ECF subfamily)